MSGKLHPIIPDQKNLLTSTIASQNELLGLLLRSPEMTNFLLPELKVVNFNVNQVLYEAGDSVDYVYFPLNSIVSGLAIMEDGTTLETSMVGREGIVGISAVLGSGRSRQWVWVSISGVALQLRARLLDEVLVGSETALKALLQTYRALVTQVSQRCVCNTRHTILERLSCWLLMIHDRVGGTNLSLTQEMIASRVGARRAGITVAASLLQTMKAIEYRRGRLHIVNRKLLEQTVWECYKIMSNEYRFTPPQRNYDYSTLSL